MAVRTFHELDRRLLATGIHLNEALVNHWSFNYPGTAIPSTWYQAIYAAGSVLRKRPMDRLTSDVIPDEYLGNYPGLAKLTLHGILNASLLRNNPDSPGMTFSNVEDSEINGACRQAEYYFAETFTSMTHPDKPFVDLKGNQHGWTLVMNDDRVVGVQKTLGEETLLTFVPATVNRIRYPAGSIFGAGLPDGYRTSDSQRLIVQSHDLVNPAFSRMSSFAIEPQARSRDFSKAILLSENNLVGSATLCGLQAIAQSSVPLSSLPTGAVLVA